MLKELQLLYEDNHLVVVDKPAGLLSQGDVTGDLDVLCQVKQIIKERGKKTGNVYLGLVHRLDRPVSGVMVVAKTSKAAARLSAQFRDRHIKKTYLAVVEGIVSPPSATLGHRLRRDKVARKTVLATVNEQGRNAELVYRVLKTDRERSLLEVDLITGLPHQIRAQLSAIDHPVVGDRKYGSNTPFPRGKIALHSWSLTIVHPTRDEPMTFNAELPPYWPEENSPEVETTTSLM